MSPLASMLSELFLVVVRIFIYRFVEVMQRLILIAVLRGKKALLSYKNAEEICTVCFSF